ncbi:uncharacterized protein BDW47DRAFT_104296 [Aspergillus candidus]|uniref:Uncharacterized protein n=1 Tax=Aspergillus candidus TaxID=41067 RepID=A0A2I2FDV5_ASPCN|nr:hypothetical protein BDW47DRAFT_104296 [Aspergillus candidus]PLB38787.1 hypothetical protein BDW47DRAFT_104296 [Aspergillus candidus]
MRCSCSVHSPCFCYFTSCSFSTRRPNYRGPRRGCILRVCLLSFFFSSSSFPLGCVVFLKDTEKPPDRQDGRASNRCLIDIDILEIAGYPRIVPIG